MPSNPPALVRGTWLESASSVRRSKVRAAARGSHRSAAATRRRPRSRRPGGDAVAIGRGRQQDGAKRLEHRSRRAVLVLVQQEAVPMPAIAVGANQGEQIARVVLGMVRRVGLDVEGDVDVVRRHHVHQRRDHLVDIAVGSPPADVDRADAGVGNPPRVPLDHRGRARIVEAERRHVVRGEVSRRMMTALRPVLPGIVAIPGVVLEDEMPPQIGVQIGERRAPGGIDWRHHAERQRRRGHRLQKRSARRDLTTP